MNKKSPLRERLIDAGVELVLAEGSASVGLREIARRAGVSHGAPRRHFPTHHALLSAIAHRGFEDLAARVAHGVAAAGAGGSGDADGDPAATARTQVAAIARVYVGYALECRGMWELMFRHELLDSGPRPTGPRLRDSTLPMFRQFVELVARSRTGQDPAAAGTAPAPAVTAAALWANLHGLAQLWAWGSLPLALPEPAEPADDGGVDAGAGGTASLRTLDRLVQAALDAHLGPVTR